nr:hypothetical protein [Chromobacterium sp. ATCC 53434]
MTLNTTPSSSKTGFVAGLQPDRPARLVHALEAAVDEDALFQLLPQVLVGGAAHEVGWAEDPVVLADDFLGGIAGGAEEVGVGGLDDAVRGEFDDGHRAIDRLHDVSRLMGDIDLAGDVHREFEHLDHLAVLVVDRVVAGLQPDGAAVLGEALELVLDEAPGAQHLPEGLVFLAGGEMRLTEHPVVLADDFVGGVAHGLLEIGIGRDDGAVRAEFYDGRRLAQRVHHVLLVLQLDQSVL